MKKILALITTLVFTTTSFPEGLAIDFSKEFNYSAFKMNGCRYSQKHKDGEKRNCTLDCYVNFMVHSSLSDNRPEMFRAISYVTKIFTDVEKTIPDTVKEFKRQKGKIFLYELEFSKGGMEYVRPNQSKWDRRHNHMTDNSIIIARAFSYSKSGHNGFAYLLHEMTHFHHLNILKDKFDREIKAAYKAALSNPKYVGTYAASNYLEYFAEISTAYLLESHRTSRFPKGSKELYNHDRIAYNLCKKIWGEKLAAYKPPAPQVAALRPYDVTPQDVVAAVKHNPYSRCTRCSTSHAMSVFKTPTEEGILMSKKFLEVVYLINRAETERNDAHASWMKSNALFMLKNFKAEYPNYRVGVINDMINSLKPKIN